MVDSCLKLSFLKEKIKMTQFKKVISLLHMEQSNAHQQVVEVSYISSLKKSRQGRSKWHFHSETTNSILKISLYLKPLLPTKIRWRLIQILFSLLQKCNCQVSQAMKQWIYLSENHAYYPITLQISIDYLPWRKCANVLVRKKSKVTTSTTMRMQHAGITHWNTKKECVIFLKTPPNMTNTKKPLHLRKRSMIMNSKWPRKSKAGNLHMNSHNKPFTKKKTMSFTKFFSYQVKKFLLNIKQLVTTSTQLTSHTN